MLKNKRVQSILVISALIMVLFSSCRARFYTPNRHVVPMFKKSGEVFIDGSMNMFNKMDITAGAALTDNIGAYVGYAGASQTAGSDSVNEDKYRYRGNMLNAGFGFFVNQDQSETFRFEIYGDFGYGSFKNRVTGQHTEFFNGNYTRMGIMPSIGYRSVDDAFTLAYTARFSQLKFFNESYSDPQFWADDLKRYRYAPSYNMLEHALTMRLGGERIKFQMQAAIYQALNADRSDNLQSAVPYTNMAFMIGIVYNLYLKQ